ncbi:MAG TPA: GNAT family N-acetyltransferase [Thermoanaerobaculia bacterium]
MLRPATRSDLPLIRDILGRSNDAAYDIRPVIEEKCFGDGPSGPTTVTLFDDVGVAVTCGRYLRLIAVDRDHRRRGIGTRLLEASNATIAFAEPGNYFTPGVWDKDWGTLAFFKARGFAEGPETWNLTVDTTAGGAAGAPLSTPPPGDIVEFVRAEFGNIWAFEVARAHRAVYIDDVGFAVVEANNRGLGTFGPAGVKKTARGGGHGRALVVAALGELRQLGFRQATIPWTNANDFYRKTCGAAPAHRFITLARPVH